MVDPIQAAYINSIRDKQVKLDQAPLYFKNNQATVVPKRLTTEIDAIPGRNRHKLYSEEGFTRLLALPRKTPVPKDFVLPSFKEQPPVEEYVRPKSRNYVLKPSRLTERRNFFTETENFINENFRNDHRLPTLSKLPFVVPEQPERRMPVELPQSYQHHITK